MREIHSSALKKEVQGWDQRQIFWDNRCPLHFLIIKLNQLDHHRRREERSRMGAMLAKYGLSKHLLANVQSKKNEMDEMKLSLAKKQTISYHCDNIFTEICLHHNIMG